MREEEEEEFVLVCTREIGVKDWSPVLYFTHAHTHMHTHTHTHTHPTRPIMYWNLVWYFSRLQLPTYLPLLPLWSLTRGNQELRKVAS